MHIKYDHFGLLMGHGQQVQLYPEGTYYAFKQVLSMAEKQGFKQK